MRSVRHSLLPLAVALLAAASLPSCAVRHVSFSGVSSEGTAASEVRYTLESDAGVEGSIVLDVVGRPASRSANRLNDEVEVIATVDNLSEDVLTLFAGSAKLTDDAGREWQLVATKDVVPAGTPDSPNEPLDFVLRGPRRGTIQLFFDAGAADVIDTTGSVTLTWAYRFRGQKTNHKTRFIPTRRTRVVNHYYGSSFGFGFGGAHFHRHRIGWCP